jgi:hypothetical protein
MDEFTPFLSHSKQFHNKKDFLYDIKKICIYKYVHALLVQEGDRIIQNNKRSIFSTRKKEAKIHFITYV